MDKDQLPTITEVKEIPEKAAIKRSCFCSRINLRWNDDTILVLKKFQALEGQ